MSEEKRFLTDEVQSMLTHIICVMETLNVNESDPDYGFLLATKYQIEAIVGSIEDYSKSQTVEHRNYDWQIGKH